MVNKAWFSSFHANLLGNHAFVAKLVQHYDEREGSHNTGRMLLSKNGMYQLYNDYETSLIQIIIAGEF